MELLLQDLEVMVISTIEATFTGVLVMVKLFTC